MTTRLLSLLEVADVLGCSTRTVRRRVAAGQLPVFRDGGLVRVPERALAEYVACRTTRPTGRGAGAHVRPSPRPSAVTLSAGRRLADLPDPLPVP